MWPFSSKLDNYQKKRKRLNKKVSSKSVFSNLGGVTIAYRKKKTKRNGDNTDLSKIYNDFGMPKTVKRRKRRKTALEKKRRRQKKSFSLFY